jgi:hypothetical protein
LVSLHYVLSQWAGSHLNTTNHVPSFVVVLASVVVNADYVVTSVHALPGCKGSIVAVQVQYPTGCNDVGLLQSYSLKCSNASFGTVSSHHGLHCNSNGSQPVAIPGGCYEASDSFAPTLRAGTSGFLTCVSSPGPYEPPPVEQAFSFAYFDPLPSCPESLVSAGDALQAISSLSSYRACVPVSGSMSLFVDCNSTAVFETVFSGDR